MKGERGMDLTEEDVIEILKIIENSDFDYFQLELGEMKLVVNKNGYMPSSTGMVGAPPTERAEPTPKASPAVIHPPEEKVAAASSVRTQPKPAEAEGLVQIPSPMVGTFYAAPEPGAPPFVTPGVNVDEDTTLGLIEVMKVFTSIRAGVRGQVVQVLVENAQFVEFGQPLFLVKPEITG
jgi:acetyl-CoA carboxylase biotin carboxyl carrier protein